MSSMQRVKEAAEKSSLDIEIREMDQSTRTAQEAADACGCDVSQIVKSLIFERKDNGELVLVLVSGANNADTELLAKHFGSQLGRADPRKVRDVTGFAIGGVAPIGHLCALDVVVDEHLQQYEFVWSAAGKPNAVFKSNFAELLKATGGAVVDLKLSKVPFDQFAQSVVI